VPFVSFLSFGLLPGICGDLPVFQIVSPLSAADATSGVVAIIDVNIFLVHSLRLLILLSCDAADR